MIKEKLIPPGYLAAISGTMFALGVAGGLKYSWKGKARPGVVMKVAGVFMAGTALCCGSFGLVIYGISKYLNVNSFREFGDRMRVIVAEKKAENLNKVATSETNLPNNYNHNTENNKSANSKT